MTIWVTLPYIMYDKIYGSSDISVVSDCKFHLNIFVAFKNNSFKAMFCFVDFHVAEVSASCNESKKHSSIDKKSKLLI